MIPVLFRSAALCVAATVLATAVEAQQVAPSSPPRPATGAPAESHLAAARELAGTSGILRVYETFVPQFDNQVRRTLVTRPELTKDLDQVLGLLRPELEQQKQAMVDKVLRAYTSAFTEAEMKDIVTFFKTPAGQRYIQNGPRLVDILATETQRWSDTVAGQFMSRVRAEMAKRGHQLCGTGSACARTAS